MGVTGGLRALPSSAWTKVNLAAVIRKAEDVLIVEESTNSSIPLIQEGVTSLWQEPHEVVESVVQGFRQRFQMLKAICD